MKQKKTKKDTDVIRQLADPAPHKKINTNFLSKIYTYKFPILIIIFLLLATILRFYNYQARWGIGSDDSRDIAIAREALIRHELPLIGSFSSAGPFVFGPLFYWIIMGSYLILPFVFTAPVIITGLAGVATVGILTACGYFIGGKRLALLTGILAATSPQLTIRSTVLGQHSYVAISTALLFLSFILYWQRKKLLYAFLMGISLGAALSFHYQSINLLIFFSPMLFIPKMGFVKKLIGFGIMFLGFLIPSLPLIIWDSQQQWANFRNILDYLLIAQYRLYVPNSWKLFLFKYIPSYWSVVVSGYLPSSLFLMLFTACMTVVAILKRKITTLMIAFSSIFVLLLFVNRFYKGERSEGYLIYLSPFVILFTSWSVNKLFEIDGKKIYKIISQTAGFLILLVILMGNLLQAITYERASNTKPLLDNTISFLSKQYPSTKFNIYDFHNKSGEMSQSLSLLLKLQDKTDPHGKPIGFVCLTSECPQNLPKITALGSNTIVDMQKVSNRDTKSSGWVKVNQENMYDDLIGWSKRHELKSTFSLWGYISSKFQNKK